MATRRRWTREAIRAEPESIAAGLGRIPTGEALVGRGGAGASSAMQRYGGVALWRERTTAAMPSGEVAVTCEEIARHAYHGSLERDGDDAVAHGLDAGRELSEATRR